MHGDTETETETRCLMLVWLVFCCCCCCNRASNRQYVVYIPKSTRLFWEGKIKKRNPMLLDSQVLTDPWVNNLLNVTYTLLISGNSANSIPCWSSSAYVVSCQRYPELVRRESQMENSKLKINQIYSSIRISKQNIYSFNFGEFQSERQFTAQSVSRISSHIYSSRAMGFWVTHCCHVIACLYNNIYTSMYIDMLIGCVWVHVLSY